MSKYSRFHSNYIRRKVHKRLHDSVIFERDWVTTNGGIQRLAKGQTAIYGDGNFIFTTSNVSNPKRKHVGGSEAEIFTYEDVENIESSEDISSRPFKSKDLRDFAYYGSCTELVRSAVEGIILEFPGRITSTGEPVNMDMVSGIASTVYRVNNPFNIDIHHEQPDEIEIGPLTNPMRYMCLSKEKYNVTDFSVTYDSDVCIIKDKWTKIGTASVNGIIFYICRRGTDIIYFSQQATFNPIQPTEETIEDYFKNLDGFEAVLLNRESKPYYMNKFVTPIMGELVYKYVDRIYAWPSKDGFIDIDTPAFYSFLDRLIEMASAFDSEWTDNLYGRMTHEAIKRYDTTFDRSYVTGDEENMVNGGERMEKTLRVIGSIFDDVKRTIDGIKRVNDVGYGLPNSGMDIDTVDDKLELSGWEVYSTIPTGATGEEILEEADVTHGDEIRWYPSLRLGTLTAIEADNEFRKRLLLSAKYINSAKGTIHGIEMVLALFGLKLDEDYKIKERYRTLSVNDALPYDETMEKVEKLKPYYDFDDDGNSEIPGVPLKPFCINGNDIVIPFYEKDKIYADPNFYFESKGGWGKNVHGDENHLETMNYLKVVSDFGDLLRLNAMDLEKGMIYYVVNLATYVQDAEVTDTSVLENLTHFFVCDQPYLPTQPSSWINIEENENDGLWQRCAYLDSIINTSQGNNPHTGYGNYDDGKHYWDTLAQPYKYASEYKIDDSELKEITDNEIVFNGFADTDVNEYLKNENNETYFNSDKIILSPDMQLFGDGVSSKDIENFLYTDKTLEINFIIPTVHEDEYKEYVQSVIVPYLLQVIPSTTILSFTS